MNTILVTGASGHVGSAIIRYLTPSNDLHILKAIRDNNPYPVAERHFDFDDLRGSLPSLNGVDTLFLLRPPHIADTDQYFRPVVEACVKFKVKHIVFLSVQGAERIGLIPHAKIEKMIVASGIPYTFIRPSYFMQNLTSTFRKDIMEDNRLFVPAGKTPFLWIDTDDVGHACAAVLLKPELHRNKAYTVTGTDLLNFHEVAERLSVVLGRAIQNVNPSLIRFAWAKWRAGEVPSFILVQMLLHFLPRFDKVPPITDTYFKLTGLQPHSLDSFIALNFKPANLAE